MQYTSDIAFADWLGRSFGLVTRKHNCPCRCAIGHITPNCTAVKAVKARLVADNKPMVGCRSEDQVITHLIALNMHVPRAYAAIVHIEREQSQALVRAHALDPIWSSDADSDSSFGSLDID